MHKAFKKNRKNNYKVKQLALHVKQNIQANQSTIIISNLITNKKFIKV